MRRLHIRRARDVGMTALIVGLGAAAAATAAAAPANPTLAPSEHVAGLPAVTYTQSISLSGRESLGARTVELQADPFPFSHGFSTVAREQTGASGNYAFRVSPSHATRYRVEIATGGPTSRVVTVYVLEKLLVRSCNLCTTHSGPGTHTLRVHEVGLAPPGPIGVTGPAYFYYGQVDGFAPPTVLTRRKTIPLVITNHRESISVSYRVTFPAGPAQFVYEVCFKDAERKDGLGLPGHHHCGAPTIRRGGYLG